LTADREAAIRESLTRRGGPTTASSYEEWWRGEMAWLLGQLTDTRRALMVNDQARERVLAELAAARERDKRLVEEMDECLNDEIAWPGEDLVELIERARAALAATEEQAPESDYQPERDAHADRFGG
jgi:hypothetical protein